LSDLLVKKLSHEGSVILYARTGEEALEILRHETPDVILLDILLPGMSGFDVLKTIRENPRMAHVPIIILSNFGKREDFDKAKALGAHTYLVKAEHDLNDIMHEIVASLASAEFKTAPIFHKQ
jgi:CheY-like chemotaxis protein